LTLCHNIFEKGWAALEQFSHLGRRAHQHIQCKKAVRKQVRDSAVPFKDVAAGEGVGDNE